jgi:hypothetical protein
MFVDPDHPSNDLQCMRKLAHMCKHFMCDCRAIGLAAYDIDFVHLQAHVYIYPELLFPLYIVLK